MSNLAVLLLFFALCFSAFVFASGPHAHQTHTMMREVSNLDGQHKCVDLCGNGTSLQVDSAERQ